MKRKQQGVLEESERLKKRERDLMTNLETETRVNYEGIVYSPNSLLLQLQSRDKELSLSLEMNKQYEEQINKAQEIIKSY